MLIGEEMWATANHGLVLQLSSTMEAEYVALAAATREAKWLTMVFDELGISQRMKLLVILVNHSHPSVAIPWTLRPAPSISMEQKY
uniref:Reverse transcriptase Ty1/copia-type domain-containing protein n=1 Tax=Trichuris muris TaxID=70415 RepID=A0A5S6QFN9_TRIMR